MQTTSPALFCAHDSNLAPAQGCFPCPEGTVNSQPGAPCEQCAKNFILKRGATTCEPCESMDTDKMVRPGASNCSDVVCLPAASHCLIQAETALASTCTHDGFGWAHRRPSMCDVCSRNYFSQKVLSQNGLVLFNRCVECPPNYETADIGMVRCSKCKDLHVRMPGAITCSLCPTGTRVFPRFHVVLLVCENSQCLCSLIIENRHAT